jgi:hypothetical protein
VPEVGCETDSAILKTPKTGDVDPEDLLLEVPPINSSRMRNLWIVGNDFTPSRNQAKALHTKERLQT